MGNLKTFRRLLLTFHTVCLPNGTVDSAIWQDCNAPFSMYICPFWSMSGIPRRQLRNSRPRCSGGATILRMGSAYGRHGPHRKGFQERTGPPAGSPATVPGPDEATVMRRSTHVEKSRPGALTLARSLAPLLEVREPRAESREPRAESREPRAESREPRAESREPRAESREPRAESREPRAESREPRAESREPRAESREPRAESREPRAESREPRAESRDIYLLTALSHTHNIPAERLTPKATLTIAYQGTIPRAWVPAVRRGPTSSPLPSLIRLDCGHDGFPSRRHGRAYLRLTRPAHR